MHIFINYKVDRRSNLDDNTCIYNCNLVAPLVLILRFSMRSTNLFVDIIEI